jgi:hypothetical protein
MIQVLTDCSKEFCQCGRQGSGTPDAILIRHEVCVKPKKTGFSAEDVPPNTPV